MYGYVNYEELTLNNILQRTTQEEIFFLVFKKEIIVDKGVKYLAPYRNDKKADCYFREYKNSILFVDFAEGDKPMNCVDVLKKTYNLSYRETLEFINRELNLGLGGLKSSSSIPKIDVVSQDKETLLERSERTEVYFKSRKFNVKDKLFWDKYKISSAQLIQDGVYPIEMYRSKNTRGYYSIVTFDIAYAYTDFGNEDFGTKGAVKIYRPENSTYKWFTNCNANDIGGLSKLNKNKKDQIIIAKSYKDYRVLKNLGIETIWIMSETIKPNPTVLKKVLRRYKEVIVFFDNDETGKKNSKVFSNYISSLFEGKKKSRHIYLPIEYLEENIKDPSDLIVKSEKELITFLKNNNIKLKNNENN